MPTGEERAVLALQLLFGLTVAVFATRTEAHPDPRREVLAGRRLPYARHLDDATIETRDGRLLQFIHLTGFPFETADTEELNYRKSVRETMLRGVANSRFGLYHHVIRREADPELTGSFPDPFSADLDERWRERLNTRRLYVNDLFLTLVRRPAPGRIGVIQEAIRMVRGAGDRAEAAAELVRDQTALNAATDGLLSALQPYGARLLTAYKGPQGQCSEQLEFLSLLYNGEMRPVRLPDADLGLYLPYRRVSFGANALEWGPAGRMPIGFAAMLSVKDYPGQTTPGMMDDLLRLPAEMVLTESFGFVDRQQTLDRMNLALRRMRAADDEALSLRADLTTAKDDVAAGRSAFGEHHLTVMVKAASLDGLNEAAADVQSAFTELGVISVREDVNLEPAVVQLNRYLRWNTLWTDHNVSCTISYSPDELPAVAAWLDENWDRGYIATAFMRRTDPTMTAKDLGHPYLPQEVVGPAAFYEYKGLLRPADFSGLHGVYDTDEAGCANGSCPSR